MALRVNLLSFVAWVLGGGVGGGLLPYTSYIGRCGPKGLVFDFGLKQAIAFNKFSLKG